MITKHDFIDTLERIRMLPAREREIICERFGLYDGQIKTLENLGLRYSLTRERVRQIEKEIMGKLTS